MAEIEDDDSGHATRIRAIRRTRRGMLAERLLRALWAPLSLVGAIWALAAFGGAELLDRPILLVLGAIGLVFAVFLLWRGMRDFVWPTEAEARDRIDETLPGRPLQGLGDRPALGADDPAAQAVWQAHMARLRRAADKARAVPADLRLARFDPWALRLVALVAVLAAALFARDRGMDSVAAALSTDGGSVVATGPTFEGWAEPPAYTGRPTLYLPEVSGEEPVALPVGTRVTLRAYGGTQDFELAETVSGDGPGTGLAEAAPGIQAADMDLARNGSVILRRDETELAAWSFTVEPDRAPEITAAGPLEANAEGAMLLPFEANDDYGVTGARVVLDLDLATVDRRYGLEAEPEARPAIEAELPLPMSGATTRVTETLVEDHSKHPWAGLPVRIRLEAEDAAGQIGTEAGVAAVLPGRSFYDPVAKALVEQRRDLLWTTENGRRVLQVLRAVTHRADATFGSPRAYLVTRTAVRRLAQAEAEGDASVLEVRDEIAEALWQAATILEDGSLGNAADRLARAKERLQEALRNNASDEEIARLMDELREATRDYMEQMAREALERGEMQSAENQQGQTMSQDQIQELMDRIQELSEQGRRAEAEALLEMLQQMLENMQMMLAEGQPGEGQGSQGQQSMQGLADALREQQGLADESFQQLQEEFRSNRQGGAPGQMPPQQGMPGGEPGGEQAMPGPDPGELAERQEALRQLMDQLENGLPGEAGEGVREALREAERNMGEARDGLEQGSTSEALDRQAEAIDNIREGMRELGEDMRRAETGGQDQTGQSGQAEAGRNDDPLGRPLGSRGSLGTNERLLPEGDPAARARAILDEIRRRSGDLTRPEIELDYLRRLLDRF